MKGIHDVTTCVRFGDDHIRGSVLVAGLNFSISQ